MYCTGGIRCEKASAYMLHNGFKNIYHVEGGIIEYTRKAKEQGLPLSLSAKTSCSMSAWASASPTM